MKKVIKIFIVFLTIVLLMSCSQKEDEFCSQLKDIKNSDVKLLKLKSDLNTAMTNKANFEKTGKKNGLLLTPVTISLLNVDWKSLDIDVNFLAVEFVGEDVSYQDFDRNKVEYISLLYGRDSMFVRASELNKDILIDGKVLRKKEEAMVVCQK